MLVALATQRCPTLQPCQLPHGAASRAPTQSLCAQGYSFYVSVLYVLAAAILLSLLLCVWVGWCFKNDRFPAVW